MGRTRATADKNRLDTGTLGFSNIENRAGYQVEHQSVCISSGGSVGGQFVGNMASGLLTGMNSSGSDSSTTKAAVSEGTIVIRDRANQQQDVNDLSRDVEHANQTLSPIFDKEKEQRRLKEAQLIGEIGSQAATAAVQGLAGGNVGAAIAGAASPYLAEVIHNMTTDAKGKVNAEANLIAHAVLDAVTSAASGNSALAGASGAVMGEYIAQQLYPGVPRDELNEEQRQTISALGTLAAGLAGGLAGDSTADAVAGAQAGKNAVENNAMGAAGSDLGFWLGKTPDCDTACKANIAKGVAEGNLVVSAGMAGVAGGAMIVGATPEIVAAAKAALEGCKAAPTICLNNAGLQVAEAVTPGGVGAAGAIGVGKTAVEATAAKAEAVAVNAAKNVGKGTTGSLTGSQTKLPPNATPENIRSLVRENESAKILSENGFHVEQNPVTSGIKNPDYKLNGEIFDNYAPSSGNIRNIWREVEKKVEKGQTNSVVINLADTKASVSDLQKQFSDWPVKGLDKIIVIDQSGKPMRIK